MQVVDIGCGIGSVTVWIAQHVGPTGQVVGVDMSAAQLEVARQGVAAVGVTNVVWHEASAYELGLPLRRSTSCIAGFSSNISPPPRLRCARWTPCSSLEASWSVKPLM